MLSLVAGLPMESAGRIDRLEPPSCRNPNLIDDVGRSLG